MASSRASSHINFCAPKGRVSHAFYCIHDAIRQRIHTKKRERRTKEEKIPRKILSSSVISSEAPYSIRPASLYHRIQNTIITSSSVIMTITIMRRSRHHDAILFLFILLGSSNGFFALVVPRQPPNTRRAGAAASSPQHHQHHHHHQQQHQPSSSSFWNRRDALLAGGMTISSSLLVTTMIGGPDPANASSSSSSSLILSSSSSFQPKPQGIVTVILDSPDVRLGVKLEDVVILINGDVKSYPVVQAVSPTNQQLASSTSTQGVVPGMIVLGGGGGQQGGSSSSSSSAGALVQRLQRGPYPFAVQFYDLSFEYKDNVDDSNNENSSMGASAALERAKEEAKLRSSREESSNSNKKEPPAVSAKGTGLVVKTTRKVKSDRQGDDCTLKARRGDTVKILYEARVASPGGPIYDSTAERGGEPVTFQLGDGKAILGVDVGLGGMCQGEVREIDIPSGLGYGRFGSDIFDIPGDVRLWWRVELVELIEGEKRFPFR